MIHRKKIFVCDLDVGCDVYELFAVTQSNLKSYGSGQMLHLRLADRSGKVNAVIWDASEKLESILKAGCLVRIKGKVGRYQGAHQINVQGYELHEDLATIDPADFLPSSTIDVEEHVRELKELGEGLGNPFLSALWRSFFEDEDLFGRFKKVPAGKTWHHATVGGLLEHTRMVLRICEFLSDLYPDLDRGVLLSGALFHDVGKVQELSSDVCFGYTDPGRLIGHLALGYHIVRGYMDRIPDFPEELANRVLHLILAHHNEEEGSPRKPLTMEALLLHFADNIDAQHNAIARELEKIEDPKESWTGYVKLIDRYLYRGRSEAEGNRKGSGSE